MKSITIFIITLAIYSETHAQSNWAQGGGGLGADQFSGIAYDDAGNVYATGYFVNTATFGTMSINCSGSTQGYTEGIFLNKYSSSGALLWSKVISYLGAYSVTLKPIVIAGNSLWLTGGTIGFESGAIVNQANCVYVVQTDLNGNTLYANTYGSSSTVNASAYAISADQSGNIYIAGRFGGAIEFGNYHLSVSSSSPYTQYFARISTTSKEVSLAIQNESSVGSGRADVVQRFQDKIIIGGFYAKSVKFQSLSFVNSDKEAFDQPFIAAFDTIGNCLWIAGAKGTGIFSPYYGLAADGQTLYAVGTIDGDLVFDGINIKHNSPNNMLIAAYDITSGKTLWVKRPDKSASPTAINFLTDIHIADQKLICAGSISDTSYIDNQKIVTAGGEDIFIGTFDESGNLLEYTLGGGKNDDQTYQTQYNAENGNFYVSGWYLGSKSVFDGDVLTNQGPKNTSDVFFWVHNLNNNNDQLNRNSAIESAEQQQLSIYPNPASTYITITANNDLHNAEIELMDISGRSMYSMREQNMAANTPFKMDLTNFHNGIYFLRLKSDQGDETERIIVNK